MRDGGHHFIWCLDRDTGKERHFDVPYSIYVYVRQLEQQAKKKPPVITPGASGSSFQREGWDVV